MMVPEVLVSVRVRSGICEPASAAPDIKQQDSAGCPARLLGGKQMAKRVFVGNLPFSATEEELRQLFAQHGEVSSVEVVKDRFTERSRGFAFVEMATDDGTSAAVAALNQHELGGRPLTVNVARPRSESREGRGPGHRDDRGSDDRW